MSRWQDQRAILEIPIIRILFHATRIARVAYAALRLLRMVAENMLKWEDSNDKETPEKNAGSDQ